MQKITGGLLFISALILSIGTMVGWILTQKLVDANSGVSFIKFSIVPITLIFLSQAIIFQKACHYLYFQLIFLTLMGFTMMWLMSCLFLPAFWLNTISIKIKILMAIIYIYIAIGNFFFSLKEFDKKWREFQLSKKLEKYIPYKNTTNWGGLMSALELQGKLYILGIPKFLTNVITILIIPCMLLGLSLRGSYPAFSVFAWGIPSAIIAAFFLQMAGYNFAQAKKISTIQREENLKFPSSD